MRRKNPDEEKIWTILEVVQWTTKFFQDHDVDSPRLTIELLLCHVLGVSRIYLYTDHDRPLTTEERSRLREYVRRRAEHEPLQYILGKANFYGLDVAVDPHVLIPRPETELLAERAIRWLKDHPNALCLDIGTGSGCIPIAACLHERTSRWLGIDMSHEALDVAHRNAVAHSVQDRFEMQVLDILDTMPMGRFQLITMNPPYIPPDEIETLQPEVRLHEPHTALTDNADGLRFYRRFAEIAPDIMAPGGVALLEIGHGQKDDVGQILRDRGLSCSIVDDMAGIPRLAIVENLGVTNS